MKKEITLTQFSTKIMSLLTEFEIYWRRSAKGDSESFPTEMEVDEWLEHFETFIEGHK